MIIDTAIKAETELVEGRFKNNADRWQAVIARDKSADGAFFFSVATTGVYCRPSCGARQPRRENVCFYDLAQEAEKAGFRPCKRCKPDQAPSWDHKNTLVAKACRFIEQAETVPVLAEIAAEVGLSPYHFHRIFKEITGVTPKAYATGYRTRRVKNSLRETDTVTEAIYDAGYNANSRFYENARTFLGMTPQQYRAGGEGQIIRYTIRLCSLGMMLLAATKNGVCTIQFGDDIAALEAILHNEFPGAILDSGDSIFDTWVDAALALVETGRHALDTLPLDIQGTAFQQKVWRALQKIPAGTTVSYQDVAKQIDAPQAARAVARACATNRIAVAIPCHRVVRKDGSTSGYRWGRERKLRLLDREAGNECSG